MIIFFFFRRTCFSVFLRGNLIGKNIRNSNLDELKSLLMLLEKLNGGVISNVDGKNIVKRGN